MADGTDSRNILEHIAAATRERVHAERRDVPYEELLREAERVAAEVRVAQGGTFTFPFERALRAPGMSFICEVKRASPSKGLIAADFDPVAIARDYEQAGAAAISCLTEPTWFMGSDAYLRDIAQAIAIPVLKKDFVVDTYQVLQARVAGAAAVLLIVSLLTDDELVACIELAHRLGLSALVEAYEPDEVPRALAAGARVVGVNNRDLRTFAVDFGRSIDLRPLVGEERVFVSESGVETRADVARLEAAGVDAVLIGETLMRAADKRAMLDELRGRRARAGAEGGVYVKLCGMSRPEDIEALVAAAPDACGFVVDVPTSRRSVDEGRLTALCRLLGQLERERGSGHIARVGVFVDKPASEVARIARAAGLDAVQLHGREDAAYLGELRRALEVGYEAAGGERITIIQAFRVRTPADIEAARASTADLVLLDNGQSTGETFDWSLVADVGRPFLLAGGITPGNVAQAIAAVRPWGVDMSSGIETDGVKDPAKMCAAVRAARATETPTGHDETKQSR